MAKEIEIETNSLASDVEQLQAFLNDITGSMDDMYEAVVALDRTWEGPANQVFNEQFNSDKQSMAELCKVIQNLINCMSFAKDEYNSCESQVNGVISAIKL